MRSGGAWSRRAGVKGIVLALVGTTVVSTTSVGAVGQQLPTELSIGDWRGHATALGVTQASEQGAVIVITGSFGAQLELTVPNEGPTTGRWDLDGITSWQLLFGGASGSAFLTHSANGDMAGDRSRIALGRSMITSSGNATLPQAGSFPVASVDPFGPLDLSVTALFCDDVYGEWILSWNTQLSAASFSPSFAGNWQARRLPGDGPSVERSMALMPELFELRDRLITTYQEAELVDGVPILPIDTISGLIRESTAILNELNNLSDCDVEYLGADNVRQWIYSYTTAVTLLTQALAAAVERATQGFAPSAAPAFTPPATELVRWSSILAASGAIGPGSLDPSAGATLDWLTSAVGRSVEVGSTEADRVTAAALADQLGLGFP